MALLGPSAPGILLDVRGGPQVPVGQNRKHRHGPAEIIGHQQESSGRVNAHIGGAGAARRTVLSSLNCPSARLMANALAVPSSAFTRPVRLIRRIQAGPRGIQSQATRARPQLVDAARCQGPGGAIHLKQVNAAAIAGRQIHLCRQHIAERRTEGAHIGHERPLGFG